MKKLCIDCKWSSGSDEFMECNAPQNFERRSNLVYREIPARRRWKFCTLHREDFLFFALMLGTCGRRGRWWESRVPVVRRSAYWALGHFSRVMAGRE